MTDKTPIPASPRANPEDSPGPQGTGTAAATASATPLIDSRTLLGRDGLLDIAHGNERYTLRKTKQGKLILTK